MKIVRAHKQAAKWWSVFLSLCLFLSNAGAVQSAPLASPASLAEGSCSVIYDPGNGWVIDMCATDPIVTVPMEIVLNGASRGSAVLVRIYHVSGNGIGFPQVAVIYSSGFVRLKPSADPSPSIPFGTSFILGPGYWSSSYYHNPQLDRLEIDTSRLPNAALRMRAEGSNQAFDVTYEMTLPPPTDFQTRLHVLQSYTATAAVTIDAGRLAAKEGFKLVQASSMFINEGGACDGGFTDCHDSNAMRFVGSDLARKQVAFTGLAQPSFAWGTPSSLGSTWVDILHTDDQGWQSGTGAGTSGNSPNARIALDELPASHTITLQGYITATTNPNDDNVNVWLHDDNPSAASWQAGEHDQIGYWLLAQDNPPEPWGDLGLRPGLTFLNFEASHNCSMGKEAGQPTTGTVGTINGYQDTALELNYNLGSINGAWVQIRCDFSPPLNLSPYDHLRFDWRGNRNGNPLTANSLQVGLIDSSGRFFGPDDYRHGVRHPWWGEMVIPFSSFRPWNTGEAFDLANVSTVFLSVKKNPRNPLDLNDLDDEGGAGTIAIDNLAAFIVGARSVPGAFETAPTNRAAARAAVGWLALQQQSSGLLISWREEYDEQALCLAHTYDQALALILFANEGMWAQANNLVTALASAQNADGSWYKTYDCSSLASLTDNKWEGDIAWAIYALSRYQALGGTHAQAGAAIQKGADWLAGQINPGDGCLIRDTTEGTIDAWWAFQSAGASYVDEAQKIETCLLTYYWDEGMGRFKGGRNNWRPYLDNQTWGAAFMRAIGDADKARRALSYARHVLLTPAQGGQLFGFDGQAGPWSVWNEGTAQYVAAGGEGAGRYLLELLAQQEWNGSMPGSPDEFNGGGVWTTRWHGVAPTAWLYNALCGGPFDFGSPSACIPFSDVPGSYWSRLWIERLYDSGVTGGCGVNPLRYCPEDSVTRAQMAVFLLRGIHTSAYAPPAVGAGTGFGDVPPDYWSAGWIKQLAAEGITAGCGNGNFCPEHPVTRAQMAVFLLRSKYGASYTPPAVGSGTGFGDVPPGYWAAAFIKQLVTEGITVGCGNGNYCPETPVTRAQMAVFLVRTFNLP